MQALLFKAQVDRNELTGEADPVVRLIDFHTPANNRFHAINQFRVDTPGCVKAVHHPGHRAVRERHSAGGGGVQEGLGNLRQSDAGGLCAAAALHAARAETELGRPEGRRAAAVPQQPAGGAQQRHWRRTTAPSPRAKSTSSPGRRCTRRTTRRWPG
jgi:hypothetical protein